MKPTNESPEAKAAAEECAAIAPRSLGLRAFDYEQIIQQAIDTATAKERERITELELVVRTYDAAINDLPKDQLVHFANRLPKYRKDSQDLLAKLRDAINDALAEAEGQMPMRVEEILQKAVTNEQTI
jgi:hypothetical protein